ncbi:MAG: leucine-rich repeat domain-containing protein [Spirochaetes bacterium]|nr:leucine-rich repeat domain-containing protein [Spirochaetota bacterium]
MTNKIYDLYHELKEKITGEKLKDISVDIINRFKNKESHFLTQFAKMLGIDSSKSNINRLFAQIIQLYHPDKLVKILNEVESHYKDNNYEEMLRLKNIYIIDLKDVPTAAAYSAPVYEEQVYADEDFGYSEYNFSDFEDLYEFEEDAAVKDDMAFQEYSFFEAVNNLYFGNLNLNLSVSDLNNLDGELDLSDFELTDLKGIENCVNISSLNLSANNLVKIHFLSALTKLNNLYLSENSIEDISALASLSELKELDISFNEIDDISVLLELTNLKYVNLINNPVADKSVIKRLLEKGVIVIY